MYRLQLFDLARLHGPDGPEISLWRPQAALLAYLALEGVSDRSAVAGLLWPDASESAARGSLRQAVYRLRKEAEEVLRLDRDRLSLSDRIRVDVASFEALLDAGRPAEAVELYTGDFLARLELRDSPDFAHWADAQRERLRRRLEDGLAPLTEDAAAAGRWEEALRWARRWAEAAPYSEAACGQLVLLQAQTGDRSRALATHESFRSRLQEALGASPGPDFERLAERIRESVPKSFSVAPTLGPDEAPDGAPAFAPAELPLVGREEPFEELGRRWEAARAGHRQVVVVSGETGIGKSRLVREFTTRVRLSGATVARADAYEAERHVPYAVLAAALRSALDAPGLAAVDAVSLGELTRILPELSGRWAGGVAEPSEDPALGRLRLLEAAASVVDNLAYERPLLLVLDDLPWADRESLTALHYACRQVPGAPWMLLATARSEELAPGDRVTRLLARLRREDPAAFREIRLEPLGAPSVARLLSEARSGEEEGEERRGRERDGRGGPGRQGLGGLESLAARLHEETGGNPLFLSELLRARAEGVETLHAGGTVGDVVRERLGRLSPEASRLLETASVLGRRFPLPLAARLAGLRTNAARDAVGELSRRHLVRQVAYAYDFAHDLVRRTIYEDLPPVLRRTMHRRAFEGLAPEEGAPPPGRERASALAKHAVLGELPAEAYRWNMEAARLAGRVYAGSAAREFLEEALRFAEDGVQRRKAREALGDLQRRRTRFLEAARAYREALDDAPAGSPERVRLRIALLDACLRGGTISPEEAGALRPELGEDAARAGPDARRDLALVLGEAYLREERAEAAATEAREAVEAAREAGEAASLVFALLLEARVETVRRRFEQALGLLDEAVELARDHGLERRRCAAQVDRGLELSRRGLWAEANREWREALELADRLGDRGTVAVTCLNISDILLRQRRLEEAEDLVRRAERASAGHDFPHVDVSVAVNRALLAWFRGETSRVRRMAEDTAREAAQGGYVAQRRSALALALLVRLEEGWRGAEAPSSPEDGLPDRLAELEVLLDAGHWTWSADWDVVCLALARGRLALEDRRGALRALDDGLARVVDPYAEAVLKLEKSRILRQGGGPGEREGPGEEAAGEAEAARALSAEARALSAEARAVLERLGAAPLPRAAPRARKG